MYTDQQMQILEMLMKSHDAVLKEAMKNWQEDWPAIPNSVAAYTTQFLSKLPTIITSFKG